MHVKRDYSAELTPRFTAVEDIKDWIGRYSFTEFTKEIATPCTVCFTSRCEAVQVEGFAVEALYDFHYGEGEFAKRHEADLAHHAGKNSRKESELFEIGRQWADKEAATGDTFVAIGIGVSPEEHKIVVSGYEARKAELEGRKN